MKVLFAKCIRIYVSLILTGLVFPFQGVAEIDKKTVVGAWLFEDGAKDSFGLGNDGKMGKSAPTPAKGKFGTALDFNGNGDYLVIPHSESLNVDRMTVMAWLKLRSYADDTRIFSKEDGVVDPWSVYSLQISGVDDTKLEFRPTINGQRHRVESNASVQLDEWTHVAATFDGTDVVLYLNAAVDKTETHAGTMMQNDKDIWIGGSEFYDPRWIDGLIDEVALFNVALPQTEIQRLMESGLAVELAVSSAGKLATTWAQVKRFLR